MIPGQIGGKKGHSHYSMFHTISAALLAAGAGAVLAPGVVQDVFERLLPEVRHFLSCETLGYPLLLVLPQNWIAVLCHICFKSSVARLKISSGTNVAAGTLWASAWGLFRRYLIRS